MTLVFNCMYNVESCLLFLHDLTRESVAARNSEKDVRGNDAETSEIHYKGHFNVFQVRCWLESGLIYCVTLADQYPQKWRTTYLATVNTMVRD